MMIGWSAMSIKTTQVTNVVNIGWWWGRALICFQGKTGGTFSNYGNSVDRSGHLDWSVDRASILGNNILDFRSLTKISTPEQSPHHASGWSVSNIPKVSRLINRLLWSLHYGVKQGDGSIEDFVHGYSLPWEL